MTQLSMREVWADNNPEHCEWCAKLTDDVHLIKGLVWMILCDSCRTEFHNRTTQLNDRGK